MSWMRDTQVTKEDYNTRRMIAKPAKIVNRIKQLQYNHQQHFRGKYRGKSIGAQMASLL